MKCVTAPGNNQLVDFENLLPSCRTGATWLDSNAREQGRISVHPKINMYKQHDGTARAIKYAEPRLSFPTETSRDSYEL